MIMPTDKQINTMLILNIRASDSTKLISELNILVSANPQLSHIWQTRVRQSNDDIDAMLALGVPQLLRQLNRNLPHVSIPKVVRPRRNSRDPVPAVNLVPVVTHSSTSPMTPMRTPRRSVTQYLRRGTGVSPVFSSYTLLRSHGK